MKDFIRYVKWWKFCKIAASAPLIMFGFGFAVHGIGRDWMIAAGVTSIIWIGMLLISVYTAWDRKRKRIDI